VQEQKNSCREHEIVQPTPYRSRHARTQQRRQEHYDEQIKRTGACKIQLGLKVGVDRPQHIDYSKPWRTQKQQDSRMSQYESNGNIGCPAVKREEVHVTMGPLPQWTVA
jgi:hypothetical protein